MKPSVVSLFSGLGGLDLGFEWAGYEIIWASDIDRQAVESYSLNFDSPVVCADIAEFPIKHIPDADVIVGGPPCQSFSLVGQRRAEDPRGRLVFRFLEIIRKKRPRAFLMENVPGITSSLVEGKRLTHFLQAEFEKFGYSTRLTLLDASKYLVPQRRRRLFLVGSLEGEISVPDPAEFARSEYGVEIDRFDIGARAAIGDLGLPVEKGERATYRAARPSDFARLMRRQSQTTVALHERVRLSATDALYAGIVPPGGNYRDIPDAISTPRIMKFKQTGGRTTTYARLHPDHPSYTVNTYFRRPNVGSNFHYAEPRLITPREAMRFQALPDHFVAKHSRQDGRNALIGNAVPPLLGQATAWAISTVLATRSQPRRRSRVA